MTESLEELLELILEWSFLPVGLSFVLLTVVGSGFWATRWKRTAWLAGLGLFAASLYFGVERHEWGEVLFNGQLL